MEISGEKTLELAKIAETISRRFKVEIILAPPQASLFCITKSVKLQVISQHIDNEKVGSTTGFFIPELAKSYGVVGSLINHSEHRLDHKIIKQLVNRLRKLICFLSSVLRMQLRLVCYPNLIRI
jgi:triosephosphate isomerase